jgi:hypothetical protein
MRNELLDPLKGDARYEAVVKLVRRVYRLIDAEKDCSEALARLGETVGKPLSSLELEGVAELIDPETYAFELIADSLPLPTDLSREEMLEMLERIVANADDPLHLGYWTRCLEINTGDKQISTLIQAPELYFGDPSKARRMSAQEILDTALAAGRNDGGHHRLMNG